MTFRKTGDFAKLAAANAWVFVEEHPDSINDACMGMDMPNYMDRVNRVTVTASSVWIDFPSSFHNAAAGFIFADGHAKWNTLDRTIFPKNLWSRSKSATDSLSDTRNFEHWGGCR